MKHEFDSPVRSENEYFSTANVREVLPGATSPLAIDLLTKYFSNLMRMITRYGVDTPMAKGMMISIFGRILDDPEFLRIAREKMTGGDFQMSFKQILRQKWDLYMYDKGLQNIKRKVENYKLNF
ncbi:PPDK_N domain-containing protein [Caerostris extrusa]|uniref:PPDK_N domain-containing protein n=1 Tax=Caerostris extrusa TaxID=172846 RepID=A0AAV4MM48_CAEEX|nr:PPDK_N domain-containing protein [Caerostris extrusa]